MARKAGSPIFVPDVLRHAFLASLGALSLGAEEAQRRYERWMKRGEETQKEMEKRLDDIRARLNRKGVEKMIKDVRTRILQSSKDVRTQARKQIQKSLTTVGLTPEKGAPKAAE